MIDISRVSGFFRTSRLKEMVKKVKSIIKFVPKKVAAVSLLFAIVAVPAVIWAASGPSRATFTGESPAPYVTFDSITDNPNWLNWAGTGDERDFVAAEPVGSISSTNLNDLLHGGLQTKTIAVTDGQEYYIVALVHNDAASNLDLYAENTAVKTAIPTGAATSQTIQTTISASNSNPLSVYDDVILTNSQNFTLDYVEGSAIFFNNAGTFNLSDNITSSGVPLGYDKMDGRIHGCWQYRGFVFFKVKVNVVKPSYDLVKTVDKTTAQPGDTLTYTLTYRNTGNVALTNVVIKDHLPAGVTASGTPTATNVGATGIANLDKLFTTGATVSSVAVGGSVTITASVKVNSDAVELKNCGANTATLVNTAESSASNKPDQANNADEDNANNNSATTTVTANKTCTPGYDVAKTVDKASANPGDTINYTITVRNTGAVELTNVKINDTLPAYYENASETITSPAGHSGSIVNGGSVTLTKLPIGATATIKISYKIKAASAFPCGITTSIINRVTSSSDQDNTEDDANNNSATTTVTYACNPKYDLVKTVSPTGTVKPGDTLTYTLKFTNTGDQDLTNVVIADQLPSEVEWTKVEVAGTNASGLPTGNTWGASLFGNGVTIGKVNVGGTVTITITAKVKSDAVAATVCGVNNKTITNSATSKTDQKADQANNADEDNANNNSVNNTVTVDKVCTYSYDLIKTGPATAKPGETVTYTLTFKNTGNQPLTNVIVKDQLPNGVTYVAGSTTIQRSTTSPQKAADGITASAGLNVGTVNPAAAIQQPGSETGTVTITFQAKMPANDKLTCGSNTFLNKSSATTEQNKKEDSTTNNEVTTSVVRDCKTSYDVIKTVDKTAVKPGDTLTYTITVKNTGETEMTNIKVNDTLPAGYSSASEKVSAPNGFTGSIVKDGSVTITKLPVNGVATIKITYTVKSKDAFQCGNNSLVNKVTSSNSQKVNEDDLNNNSATTTVNKECEVTPPPTPIEKCPTNPAYNKDDARCRPCPTNPNINSDDVACTEPQPVVNPSEPCPTNPKINANDPACTEPCVYNNDIAAYDPNCKPYETEKIVATGPRETIISLIAGGALTFGIVAYLNSRKNLRSFKK